MRRALDLYLEGRAGSDSYFFARDYGQDTISDSANSSGDILYLGPDIVPSDIRVTRSGGSTLYDATLSILGTGSSIAAVLFFPVFGLIGRNGE